ncbi:hypothetical protein DID88_007856 [Monilinia fructigena]|uniref:Uncharacterized protein n=1 Tax=Monilinia fructigena TaxID=38457 RepID=A0A395J470_9HELO|nr:hypothetical protein DID88_007856 [Monilinia fructigena]
MKTNQGSKRASLSDTADNNALATSSNSDTGYNAIDVDENNESGYDFLNADHENAFAPPTPSTPSPPPPPLPLRRRSKPRIKDNVAMRAMDQVHQSSIAVLRETVASRNADVVSAEENVALHLKTIETLKQKSESRGDKISELKRRLRYHEEQEATMEQRQNQLILKEFEAGRNERRMRARLFQAVQERNAAVEELEFFFRRYLKTLADQDQFHGQSGYLGAGLEANRGRLAHDKKFHEQKYEIETGRLRRHLNRALEKSASLEQALEASRGQLAHDKQFLERKAEVETERLRRHLNRALQEARELQEENAKLKKEAAAAAAAQNGP